MNRHNMLQKKSKLWVKSHMALVDDLLGCPLLEITRSYWAVKLKDPDEWVCEARIKTDFYKGVERHYDWSNDIVANNDMLRIAELWLLCPPSATSPLGNTARLAITEPGTAFQFKIATADSCIAVTYRSLQAHIIGKVTDKEYGDCDCFIYDPVQGGLLTPETKIYDATSHDHIKRDKHGNILYAGKTNITDFHSWRPSVAHLGRLELNTIGVRV
jgi:hypothetical protein